MVFFQIWYDDVVIEQIYGIIIRMRGTIMIKQSKGLNLYQKFALTIIFIGLVPMLVLSTFIANSMIRDYGAALRSQYEQAAGYVNSSLESMLDNYNNISKMPYFYNYSIEGNTIKNYLAFDNLRQIVYGVSYNEETKDIERQTDMENFLKYLGSVDSFINSTHFIARDLNNQKLMFHHSPYSTYFKDEALFEDVMNYDNFDRQTNKMILIPTHQTGYFNGLNEPVFTVARNYFDLRGQVGNTPYVGTLFLEVTLKKVEKIFRTVKISGNEVFYVLNQNGDCFFSSREDKVGINLANEVAGFQNTEDQLVITTKLNEYGLYVMVVMNTAVAFENIKTTQRMMYIFIGASVVALMAGSLFFSKKLTKPIYKMMEQMKQVENGHFDIELPVGSLDEIGILSQRFNQMSVALKSYINQSYVAQIKQNEAELTALKAQIYPHFLYNTLEIIRMTALEDKEREKVPKMIEALAEQIHYIIGPMQDMISLEKEIDIVQKYVYLLNCRIAGKVQLVVKASKASKIIVPKLILQPIVENAYVHGIKPQKGNGSIMIEADVQGEVLEINIMDNGVGMNEEELKEIHQLLDGNEPGIKNESNWQSIGLKNVHDRIRFLYGEEYGVFVTSTPTVGTIVRIRLKKQRGGEKDENDIS